MEEGKVGRSMSSGVKVRRLSRGRTARRTAGVDTASLRRCAGSSLPGEGE